MGSGNLPVTHGSSLPCILRLQLVSSNLKPIPSLCLPALPFYRPLSCLSKIQMVFEPFSLTSNFLTFSLSHVNTGGMFLNAVRLYHSSCQVMCKKSIPKQIKPLPSWPSLISHHTFHTPPSLFPLLAFTFSQAIQSYSPQTGHACFGTCTSISLCHAHVVFLPSSSCPFQCP